MAVGILFKPRTEATEQIVQNCKDISQSKNQRERKQYASTEKNFQVPKHFMAFLRTLVTALTIRVRIMRICCCPVQIFVIN